jgi:transposase
LSPADDKEGIKEMITVEAWTAIRYMHAQGKSIRGIARELGLSRNTVRNALRSESQPRYSRAKRPNAKLAPYLDQIQEMLIDKQFIGTRILRELRALGYDGSRTALYDHLQTLKEQRVDPRVTERFETPPAHQGQFDWSPYTLSLGGEVVRVSLFCLVLSFSRRKHYWPSLDATQGSVFEALESAFHHFGGCPKNLLVDNARAFVDNASPKRFQWNIRFLELCGHYRFQPRACQPGRPRTKGKVERPFYYLDQHFIKGGAWDDLGHFARELARFTAEDLDVRVHATTGERPIDRFEHERLLLTPLPEAPFIGTHEIMRKVSWDCLLSYKGTRYSVPWPYAGKHVWLRISQGRELVIRNQKGEGIARHLLSPRKAASVIDRSHYEGLRKKVAETRPLVEQSFLRLFPRHRWFMEAVYIQHKNNPLAHLRGILALAEVYAPEALVASFDLARECNTYSHRFIRGLLESGTMTGPQPQPSPPDSTMAHSRTDLGIYQEILEATS